MIKINKQQPTIQTGSMRLNVGECNELHTFKYEYGVTMKTIVWEGMNAIKAVYPKKKNKENWTPKDIALNPMLDEENNSTNISVKPIDNP